MWASKSVKAAYIKALFVAGFTKGAETAQKGASSSNRNMLRDPDAMLVIAFQLQSQKQQLRKLQPSSKSHQEQSMPMH